MGYEGRGSTYVVVGDDVDGVEEEKRREKGKKRKTEKERRKGINKPETLTEYESTRECSALWWEKRHARDKQGIRGGT